MSDPHPGDFNRSAPAPTSIGATAAEAQEEEREPGALAPRQLPGNDLSEAAGASGALATSSVDFGFGNSWSHIPIPVADDFDAHHHHSPHHEGGGLHESQGGDSASASREDSSRAAGRHVDDDKVMSDSHPVGVSVVAHSRSSRKSSPAGETAHQTAAAAAGAGAGGLEPPALAYAHDASASSANSLAEVELGERFHAHGSSMSGRIGVDTPHGSAPAGEGGRATTTEQVSLPDDIYGAARVSEYWHGVPGLSSLASTYVYDDIWAGDGGLNPREDIMSITGWAAGGGHAATQERGGGGEAVAEIFGVGSSTGGQSRTANSSPARHASVSSGDDDRRAASEGRGRAEDDNSSSGSSGGRDGGGKGPGSRRRRQQPAKSASGGMHEDGNARDGSEERSGRRSGDGVRSWGTGGGRAHSSGATDRRRHKDEEGHTCKKRRTPSPDAERRTPVSAGMSSTDSAGTDETLRGAAVVAAAAATSREQQVLQEAEVIRWCQKVSSARAMSAAAAAAAAGSDGGVGGGSGSSGDEERFFAGRVLDPAPRPPPRRDGGLGSRYTWTASINNEGMGEVSPTTPPDFAVQHNLDGVNGKGNGVGGGGFRGDASRGDDRATAAMVEGARTVPPAASLGGSSGSQSGAEVTSATPASIASAAFSETAPALESQARRRGAAGAAHGSSSSSDSKQEAFFACHTLEPKPRLGGSVAPLAAHGGPRNPEYPNSFSGGGEGATGPLSLPLGSSHVAGSHRLIPREDEVLATAAAAAKAAAAVSEAESSSSMDWQVRPEAMMGFFTTVGGVSPPSLLRPGLRRAAGVRARSPAPGVGAARRGKQFAVPEGEPNPRGLSSSGSGSGGEGSPGARGGVDAAVAAAATRERAAEMAQDARTPSDHGSVSGSSNGWNSGSAGGGAEGGGNNSWGW